MRKQYKGKKGGANASSENNVYNNVTKEIAKLPHVKNCMGNNECPVCLTEYPNRIFKCGHKVCMQCLPHLSSCHICRKPDVNSRSTNNVHEVIKPTKKFIKNIKKNNFIYKNIDKYNNSNNNNNEFRRNIRSGGTIRKYNKKGGLNNNYNNNNNSNRISNEQNEYSPNNNNSNNLNGGTNRKCPKKSAKEFKLKTVKKGLDGKMWIVSKRSDGVKFWKRK